MKEALLDTNFILTCVRQKIDFFEEMTSTGFRILIPSEVFSELKKLSGKNENARLSLKLLENEKSSFERISLEKYGRTTDKKIINFANENKDIVVGTLDREIKNKTENQKIIIRQKKRIEIV